MLRPADDPKSNTLPDPDLNPLLNPLLAANMGRWAEVYFTSPPEKREEAVAGLIRELEGNSAEPAAPPSTQLIQDTQIEDTSRSRIDDDVPEVDRSLEAKGFPPENPLAENYYTSESEHSCAACGHINSAKQNFCGMCGASLRNLTERDAIQAAERQMPSDSRWQDAAPSPLPDSNLPSYIREPSADYVAEGETRAQELFSFVPKGAEGKRVEREKEAHPLDALPQFAREAEPVPYRYRLYVGSVLAVLLTLLVYMAWRGTKYISGTSSQQSPAARVIPPAPAVAEAVNTPSKTATVSNSSTNDFPANKTHKDNIPSSTTTSRSIAKASIPKLAVARKQTAKPKPAARAVTNAGNDAAIAAASSGAEELATAENYLNGAQGKARNAREAAQWLWKSVSKGNAAATMALSDLYLRGEGVSKSCDQARLLLHAAARKGSATAAERLRNLRPFGCQ